MDESIKKKPNIATILGVERDQWFTYRDGDKELTGLYVGRDGIVKDEKDNVVSGIVVCACVNHPENIFTKPKLTDVEIEICCSLGAKFVSADACGVNHVKLWKKKPIEWGTQYVSSDFQQTIESICLQTNPSLIAMISRDIFPSVRSGDCIAVE